jgi:PAS domain S-box-containing protein
MVGSHTDVTARRRDAEIQAGQQQFLELLATGGTLYETLDRLIRVIEEQSPGMLGLILLLDEDGKHLHIGAGPNLSPAYLDTIEGLEIGPMVGSCGTASYTGERVIVTDIATDPRWDNLRALALDSGLRACWSEPVFSPHGQVIGTFAMYYREPRTPTAAELKIISTGAHLAGVAIERRRADQALQESERRLATLMSNLPGMAYSGRYDRELSKTFVSEGSSALTGYLPGELVGDAGPAYVTLIHEDDRARVWDEVRAAVAQEQPYQMTYRIHTAAGDEKWVWEQGRAVRRDGGSVQALEGFIIDITERVEAQQMLEQRVAERTRELSTLLDVTHNVSSTLELQPLLRVILDQLKAVVDYDGASVLVLEDDMLQLVAYRGPIAQENALNIRFALADAGANRAVIEQCEPLAIGDVRGGGPLAAAFQATAGASLDTTFEYVHSWLGVPLAVKGNVVGMISLDHRETDYYTDQHCRLALAFANQVAVTLENARLYRAAEKRADEAQTLFNVQQAITSRLEREELLQLIADEARRLTGARRAAILMLNEDVPAVLEMTVLSGYPDDALLGYQVPLHGSLTGHALREGRAFRSNGEQNGTPLYEEIVRRTGSRSLLAVPFTAGDRPSGVIVVADEDASGFDDDDERIVQMLASGAVIALENADLFEAEHERRRVAESLRDVLSRLNANLPLPETLHFIVEQAMRVLGASAGIVFSVDHEKNRATVEAIAGMPDELSHHRTLPMLETAANQATMHAEPFTVPDLAAAMADEADLLAAYDPENRAWIEALEEHFGAYLSVPIIVGTQVYGDITLYYPAPRHFSDEELSLAASYGEQTSLAVENARLRQHAEQSAASAERSRLARELHDAVTQTLFSASLIAEVLPRLWERNQEMGQQRLEELRELTRGALAEMRTLLLELRPAALTESSLPELLRQLSEAVIGRSRLDVDLTVKGASDLPPEVQVALYRIAQESLNNVTKHAAASHVTVALSLDEEAVTLAITDDGRGFDPDAIPPNSLGLGIMRERVNDIGATMTIASAAGDGTTVRVRWMPRVPEAAPPA